MARNPVSRAVLQFPRSGGVPEASGSFPAGSGAALSGRPTKEPETQIRFSLPIARNNRVPKVPRREVNSAESGAEIHRSCHSAVGTGNPSSPAVVPHSEGGEAIDRMRKAPQRAAEHASSGGLISTPRLEPEHKFPRTAPRSNRLRTFPEPPL